MPKQSGPKDSSQAQSSQKARIIDIALQAGVSTATVDRVLNERPGVRPATRIKVQSAAQLLDKADGRPRIIPTVTQDITIDAVIAGSAGFANDLLARGLQQVGRDCGVTLNTAYPHRMNPEALAEALQACVDRRSSGIIVQALDHPQVRSVIAEANTLNIPVVSLLTDLPGAQTLGYVGLDNRAAGRAAACLMGRLIHEAGEIALFVGGPLYRSHEEREMGFRTVLRDEFPKLTLLPVLQSLDNPGRNYEMATELLQTRRKLKGILNVGGGNRGIEKAMVESGRQHDITWICFNLTPLTQQLLLGDILDVVIHQNMQRAASIAVRSIVSHLTSRPVHIHTVPAEIIMRENVTATAWQGAPLTE